MRLRTLPCCSSSSRSTHEPQPPGVHERDINRGTNRTKSNPGSRPNPGSHSIGNPNRCSSLIVGRSQNAARWVQYAPQKIFTEFSTLTVDKGRECRYCTCAPRGSLTSRPITGKHCGGGRSKAVLRSTFCNVTQIWEQYPRTSTAGWPEVVAGGSQ